ncbi:hypothetical protein IJ102_03140 [Candidatus Saccharibacteria bacterium]|nr:hypothetical protein [Candidatus Saccharibacteria bacterium]
MADFDYWRKQGAKPLFPEVDSMRPEQRRLAGKILVIGGNKGAFFAVAQVARVAHEIGVGECRILLPDSLKNTIPTSGDVYFAEAETSGAFGQKSLAEMRRQAAWADAVVLVGDVGRNGETSVVLVEFLADLDKPVYLARDAVDVVMSDAMNWALREQSTVMLLTMPQLQKLLRALYYPKVVTLSMPTNQLVELLHKFTLSYAMVVTTLHNEQLLVAERGEVVSMPLGESYLTPISLFDGSLVLKFAALSLWNPSCRDLQVVARSWLMK